MLINGWGFYHLTAGGAISIPATSTNYSSTDYTKIDGGTVAFVIRIGQSATGQIYVSRRVHPSFTFGAGKAYATIQYIKKS